MPFSHRVEYHPLTLPFQDHLRLPHSPPSSWKLWALFPTWSILKKGCVYGKPIKLVLESWFSGRNLTSNQMRKFQSCRPLTATLADKMHSLKQLHPKAKTPPKQANTTGPSDSPSSDESSWYESNVCLFSCPEEGCIKRYQRFSLQRHLDCGRHHPAIENESLLDRAIVSYSERPDVQSGSVPNIPTEVSKVRSVENLLLPMGWVLRSSQVKRTRFTANQKDYLTKKFDLGEISGRKADPESVSRAMMGARDSEGNRLFTSAEFLTSQQVASFFTRLAAKKAKM